MIKVNFILIALLLYLLDLSAQNNWPDSSRYQGLQLVNEQDNFSVLKSKNASIDTSTLTYIKEAKGYFDEVFNVGFPVAVLLRSGISTLIIHPWNGPGMGRKYFSGFRQICCGKTGRKST
jgi:hypothetical protein